MTDPNREVPSLHECQIRLRDLAGTVGQGVLELRKAREKWADLILKHDMALAEREGELSTAIEVAREKAKKIPREDGKRQTAEDINTIVKAKVATLQREADIEAAVLRHARRMSEAEIKALEGANESAQHKRAIWKALLESVMQEMALAGVPPRIQRRTG